ncbi:DUF559 domain-containing protein [Microbacterium sp. bgisy189]|uniref:DUF559 domain-containing protein n=1 Tax=Microbacterium sp. bgisy189 TaxID=3413798 RepID=UPI003EB8EAA2
MFEVWTRAELREMGLSGREITTAVRRGDILRPRQGCYVARDAPELFVQAVRVGGRLACVSLLAELGVFVFDATPLHVHMEPNASRMRAPAGCTSLLPRTQRAVRLHWRAPERPPTAGCVSIIDALIDAVRCQEPRYAIATLDSALNRGWADLDDIAEVFAALPARYGALKRWIDGAAQAGTETLVRLMLMRLGCHVDLQVAFSGVGWVDLVVDEWLVVECDSKEFHSSWEQQRKDYRRDRRLAELGFCVLRLTAEDILYRPASVLAALKGLLESRRTS